MAANFHRLFLFAAVCLIAGSATAISFFGHPGWAVTVSLGILCVYPGVIGVELLLGRLVDRRADQVDSVPRASFRHTVQAWVKEVMAGIRMFGWEQPFRSWAEPDLLPSHLHGARGVVFIHGLLCNRGFWNPWMRRFREIGDVPFIAVNLEPMFSSIDAYSAILETAVSRMTALTGRAPILVGHSMGGLVARRWLSDQTLDGRVERVFTIGTPHAGTWLARFANTRNGKEMSVGSRWLKDLRGRSRPQDAALFTCYFSNCDNVVFPAVNATLAGAAHRFIPASAHVQLAFCPQVIEDVLEALRDSPAP